ncbi:MAG: serine/threonine-protein kinase [Isosphaeraceae bacterium]
MLEPSASRFWQVALQSGLMDVAGLQACWDSLPEEKRTPEAIDRRLARTAVQTNRLTLWQAQQLVAGRSTGFKIDRHVLLDLLGQGGMGRVYLARDTKLSRLVAVKILSPERVNNPRAIARFKREATVGAQLQHENLVRIYDVGESNGRWYLVMEYIEGKNIGQMIAEGGPIPPGVAARLTRQVALGLEHAQRKGLIHRDVNPYNILVTQDGVAKLTDMGLAIDLADQDRVTRDGATVGTFDYVSPEQARHSHHVDTRSDIYSLGCTLYHMLCGQVPFPTASLPQKLLGHQAVDPEPVNRINTAVPAGLAEVVVRMMKKAADERYATPLDLARALEPYATDRSPDEFAPPEPPEGLTRDGVSRSTSSAIQTPGSQPPAFEPGAGLPAATLPFPQAEFARTAAVETAPAPPAKPKPKPAAPAAVIAPSDSGVNQRTEPATEPVPATALATAQVSAPAPPPAPVPDAPPAPAAVAAPPKKAAAVNPLGALNLVVDLGPDPLLGEGLASTRPRPQPRKKDSGDNPLGEVLPGEGGSGGGVRRWLLAVGSTAAVLAVLVGVYFLYPRDLGGHSSGVTKPPETPRTPETPNKEQTAEAVGKKPARPRPRPLLKGEEVEVVMPDETMKVEPDLSTAIRTAIGARGHVLLTGNRVLKLKPETIVASGGLSIRAAAGARPVIELQIRRGRPVLQTRTNSPLRIEGVTILARFVEPSAELTPVIDAGGGVTLDRCEFWAEGPERGTVPGSRALVVEGGVADVRGCYFVNFDRAFDLAAFSGSSAALSHCVFIQNGAPGAPAGGWAVRLRAMPGGAVRSGRKLVMTRCTARGQGLIDLSGFSNQTPARVDLRGCAVLADALVSWEPPAAKGGAPAEEPNRDSLSWSGEGDLLDLRGKSWLLVSGGPGQPPAPAPGGPTDLEGWNKVFGNERESVPPPLRFATDPASLSERPAPTDFAVADPPAGKPVGADPAFVGPGARASKP